MPLRAVSLIRKGLGAVRPRAHTLDTVYRMAHAAEHGGVRHTFAADSR